MPTLTYTKSNEHAWAPGTIWLSATTMLSVVDDIGKCISRTNAQKLVFLNGHGGNSALLNVVNREFDSTMVCRHSRHTPQCHQIRVGHRPQANLVWVFTAVLTRHL
ncbi:MAG: creatininase family protein [Acidimicrobiaceae bacterium]